MHGRPEEIAPGLIWRWTGELRVANKKVMRMTNARARSAYRSAGAPDKRRVLLRAQLASTELVARQLKSFFDGTGDIPRITKHMRLPAFQYAALDPYTWPRR